MTKYFISGGAGFIGGHLVDRLVANGSSVTVYDNLSSGKEKHIQHHFGKANFNFIKADLADTKTLNQAIKGHDFVFHLAANPDAREGIKNPALDLNMGTIATFNVLEAMRQNGIKKIVFSSSGTVTGDTAALPVTEEYGPLLADFTIRGQQAGGRRSDERLLSCLRDASLHIPVCQYYRAEGNSRSDLRFY